jgi:CubicO group peptidase (beta-lactamase class C family)
MTPDRSNNRSYHLAYGVPVSCLLLLMITGTAADFSRTVAGLERELPGLMKEGEIPGLAAALVWEGKLVWHRGFGVANAATNEPVRENTVFEAASLSKPVFAYAVLKLVDSGRLDLDKPLTEYLPGEYDVGPDPRLKQMTARHVLSHRTGFPNWRRGSLKIHFTPGERFSYSGEGYVYLSKVIERITGEPLNDFVKRTVFQPLGMTGSSYLWLDEFNTLAVTRHNEFGKPAGQNKSPSANAAASLQTTARDFGLFIQAMLAGTGLKPTTRELMLTPQVRVDESGTNTTSGPGSHPSPDLAWGLGWGLQTTAEGISFWHWGDNGDSKAYVVAFERTKSGLVVFTNSANGLSIMTELLSASLGGLHPALSWLKYESYKSPSRLLLKNIVDQGAESALRDYRARRRSRPQAEQVGEAQINRLGYLLLYRLKQVKDAIEVFSLNTEDFPRSANTWDSLAEAYMVAGNKELAIRHYEKSLELNPSNTDALEKLRKLRGESAQKPQ